MSAAQLQGWREASAWLASLADSVNESIPAAHELRPDCDVMVRHYRRAAGSIASEADRRAAAAATGAERRAP